MIWSHGNVRALCTNRLGGVSAGPFASLNLGMHVGDDPQLVLLNRRKLRQQLPAEPVWLNQVHGTHVHVIDKKPSELFKQAGEQDQPGISDPALTADAAVTNQFGLVLAVMTADCLPVLFATQDGSVIGAAHAGWRGLNAGVLEQTVGAMRNLAPNTVIECHFGPAIGPKQFEVGADVRDAFVNEDDRAQEAFIAHNKARQLGQPKWLADICKLAALRLASLNVVCLDDHAPCTVSEPHRWFSYRRDGKTGRMASCVWLESGGLNSTVA